MKCINNRETYFEKPLDIQNIQFDINDNAYVCYDFDDYKKRDRCFIYSNNQIYISKQYQSHLDIFKTLNISNKDNCIFGNILNKQQTLISLFNTNSYNDFQIIAQYFPKAQIFNNICNLEHNTYYIQRII